MRRATAAWRAGKLERSREGQTIKSVNIPAPEPRCPIHITALHITRHENSSRCSVMREFCVGTWIIHFLLSLNFIRVLQMDSSEVEQRRNVRGTQTMWGTEEIFPGLVLTTRYNNYRVESYDYCSSVWLCNNAWWWTVWCWTVINKFCQNMYFAVSPETWKIDKIVINCSPGGAMAMWSVF